MAETRIRNPKFKLSWRPNGYWRKRYLGKDYYYKVPKGMTQLQSYKPALAWWKQKKAEIDGMASQGFDRSLEPLYRQLAEHWAATAQNLLTESNDAGHTQYYKYANTSTRIAHYLNTCIVNGTFYPNVEEFDWHMWDYGQIAGLSPGIKPGKEALWEKFSNWVDPEEHPTESEDNTVGGCVAEYLHELQFRPEPPSLAWRKVKAAYLKHFEKHLGASSPIKGITARSLSTFRISLLEKVAAKNDGGKGLKSSTAKSILGIATSFVQWCWQEERIESLPRNIGRRDLAIRVQDQEIEVFSAAEIEQFFALANPKLRLFGLLGLNCGFTAKDISDLKHSEVDWDNGRITRKRSKTKKHPKSPVVQYKLWADTFALLKQFRSNHPELVLLTENGKQLVTESSKSRTDAVRAHFVYLKREAFNTKLAFKHFRKTSATMLDNESEYSRYIQHFLSHTPAPIADKNYKKPSPTQFDNAIDWLGQQYKRPAVQG